MISPYQELKVQRLSKPKIIISGKRTIKKESKPKKKIIRKCFKIKYFF